MDHIRIIRRAWNITWLYRALWVFGMLVALTTSRGGGGGNGGGTGARPQGGNTQIPPFGEWMPRVQSALQAVDWGAVAGVIVALVCLFFVLAVVFTILRYISNTALIRMVDGYEGTGAKVTIREGFRLGWSRGAFRLWLADLLVGVIGFAVVVLALAVVAAPLLLWLTQSSAARVVGTVLAIGLFILFLLALILAAAAVSILMQLVHRAIVLENRGVTDAFRRGWEMFRGRLGDNIIMGLILFGIGLAFSLVLIPVFFLVLVLAAITGGLPGLLAGGITSLFAHGAAPAIVGAIIGVPIFLIVLIVPLVFVGGLFETYKSSVWTLTFRELLALANVQPPAAPVAPIPPTMDATPAA